MPNKAGISYYVVHDFIPPSQSPINHFPNDSPAASMPVNKRPRSGRLAERHDASQHLTEDQEQLDSQLQAPQPPTAKRRRSQPPRASKAAAGAIIKQAAKQRASFVYSSDDSADEFVPEKHSRVNVAERQAMRRNRDDRNPQNHDDHDVPEANAGRQEKSRPVPSKAAINVSLAEAASDLSIKTPVFPRRATSKTMEKDSEAVRPATMPMDVNPEPLSTDSESDDSSELTSLPPVNERQPRSLRKATSHSAGRGKTPEGSQRFRNVQAGGDVIMTGVDEPMVSVEDESGAHAEPSLTFSVQDDRAEGQRDSGYESRSALEDAFNNIKVYTTEMRSRVAILNGTVYPRCDRCKTLASECTAAEGVRRSCSQCRESGEDCAWTTVTHEEGKWIDDTRVSGAWQNQDERTSRLQASQTAADNDVSARAISHGIGQDNQPDATANFGEDEENTDNLDQGSYLFSLHVLANGKHYSTEMRSRLPGMQKGDPIHPTCDNCKKDGCECKSQGKGGRRCLHCNIPQNHNQKCTWDNLTREEAQWLNDSQLSNAEVPAHAANMVLYQRIQANRPRLPHIGQQAQKPEAAQRSSAPDETPEVLSISREMAEARASRNPLSQRPLPTIIRPSDPKADSTRRQNDISQYGAAVDSNNTVILMAQRAHREPRKNLPQSRQRHEEPPEAADQPQQPRLKPHEAVHQSQQGYQEPSEPVNQPQQAHFGRRRRPELPHLQVTQAAGHGTESRHLQQQYAPSQQPSSYRTQVAPAVSRPAVHDPSRSTTNTQTSSDLSYRRYRNLMTSSDSDLTGFVYLLRTRGSHPSEDFLDCAKRYLSKTDILRKLEGRPDYRDLILSLSTAPSVAVALHHAVIHTLRVLDEERRRAKHLAGYVHSLEDQPSARYPGAPQAPPTTVEDQGRQILESELAASRRFFGAQNGAAWAGGTAGASNETGSRNLPPATQRPTQSAPIGPIVYPAQQIRRGQMPNVRVADWIEQSSAPHSSAPYSSAPYSSAPYSYSPYSSAPIGQVTAQKTETTIIGAPPMTPMNTPAPAPTPVTATPPASVPSAPTPEALVDAQSRQQNAVKYPEAYATEMRSRIRKMQFWTPIRPSCDQCKKRRLTCFTNAERGHRCFDCHRAEEDCTWANLSPEEIQTLNDTIAEDDGDVEMVREVIVLSDED